MSLPRRLLPGFTCKVLSTERSGLAPPDQGGTDGEDPPFAGDPLERVQSAIVKAQLGASDEVSHRTGDEDLAGSRQAGDARADVHGDSPNLAISHRISRQNEPSRVRNLAFSGHSQSMSRW